MINAARLCSRACSRALPARATSRQGVRAMAAAAGGNSYQLLRYTYVPDILEKRGPYRAAHLEAANKLAAASKLVMAGAVGDPVEGAVFIFRNLSREEVEAFVQSDAYVKNSLVTDWSIKPYAVVAGDSS